MRQGLKGTFILLTLVASTFFDIPPVYAGTITVNTVSITPSTVTDVTDQLPFTPPGDVTIKVFSGSLGTDYTAVFEVSEQPAVVVVLGGDVSSFSYDSSTSYVTIQFEQIERLAGERSGGDEEEDDGGEHRRVSEGFGDLGDSFIVGFVAASAPGGEGPTDITKGTYLSTNLSSFEVVPPNVTGGGFGFILSGPEGSDGLFKMYIPPALVAQIGEIAGETFTPNDLALFNDDKQASIAVTDVDGGALIDITVDFTETSSKVTERSGSSALGLRSGRLNARDVRAFGSVSKNLQLAGKQALSFAAKNTKVTGKKSDLYGFIKEAEQFAGSKVTLEKKSGSKWVKVGTTSVADDGAFEKKVPFGTSKKITVRAKTSDGSITSESVTVKKTKK